MFHDLLLERSNFLTIVFNFCFVGACLVFAELLLLCAPAVLKVVKVLGSCTVLESFSKGDEDKDKDMNKKTKKKIKTIIRQRKTKRYEH